MSSPLAVLASRALQSDPEMVRLASVWDDYRAAGRRGLLSPFQTRAHGAVCLADMARALCTLDGGAERGASLEPYRSAAARAYRAARNWQD